MSSIRVKLHNRRFYQLRSEPGVIRDLERRGKAIMDYANRTLVENSLRSKLRGRRLRDVGYRMSSFQGRKVKQGRWFVQVYAATNHAKYSNAVNNTLVNALNATQKPTPPAVDPGGHP